MKRGIQTRSVAGLVLLVGSVALAQQSLPISGQSDLMPQPPSPVMDSAPVPPSAASCRTRSAGGACPAA